MTKETDSFDNDNTVLVLRKRLPARAAPLALELEFKVRVEADELHITVATERCADKPSNEKVRILHCASEHYLEPSASAEPVFSYLPRNGWSI